MFRINKNYRAHVHDSGSTELQNTGSRLSALASDFSFSNMAPQNLAGKGINIDDSTAVLAPSSHNPMQGGDTFPATWPSVSGRIGSIRTFRWTAGTGGKTWVNWAVQNNVKVMVGLGLGGDSGASEIAAFVADYNAAGALLQQQYQTNIIAIAVGNEETNAASINAGLANLKNQMAMGNIPTFPVTTVLVDINNNWIQNTFPPEAASFTAAFLGLAPNLDIICFNFYSDYFSFGNLPPLTPAEALTVGLSWTSNGGENSVLLNQFGSVRAAMSKAGLAQPFWCCETGWGSRATQAEALAGWSSVPHMQTYYGNFLGFSLTTPFVPQAGTAQVLPPQRIFYFSVRDANNEFFGLFTSAAALTPKF